MGTITKESAIANFVGLMSAVSDEIDQEMAEGEGQKKGNKSLIDKPSTLICGGLEKSEVFKQAILPVMKTVSLSLNCGVK